MITADEPNAPTVHRVLEDFYILKKGSKSLKKMVELLRTNI
jgi:hypothetical protein